VSELRSGDDHDPEEELRALLPLARMVSSGLRGGGEGPERVSEARLMAAIARSEEDEGRKRPRAWALPFFAASGWVATTACLALLAYQFGVSQTYQTRLMAFAPVPNAPIRAIAPEAKSDAETKPVAPKHARSEKRKAKPEVAPPSVRVDEITPTADLLQDAAPLNTQGPDDNQNDLVREGNSQLAQGQWDKAASSYEEAANQNPTDESALDALHLSGVIAERALNDPKRALENYRREMDLCRRIDRDTASPSVKQRLTRAMTAVGMLEKNPQLVVQAAKESSDTSVTDSSSSPATSSKN
jgi:tetratricopeptide (TPR) repeat protein